MASRTFMYMAVLAVASNRALADGPFQFCTDEECQDCPVQLTDAGTGFPNCVTYSTADVFGDQNGFNGSASGGYAPFMNIAQPGNGCKIIVKSPAGPSDIACGMPVGAFTNAVCATLNLDKTFMVQFCCGTADCTAAGAPTKRSAKFADGSLEARGGGGGGAYLYDAAGNKIEPLYDGPPTVTPPLENREKAKAVRQTKTSANKMPLRVRGSACSGTATGSCPSAAAMKRDLSKPILRRSCTPDSKSWVATGADYQRPADGSTVMQSGVDGSDGGGQVTFVTERSQTWTNSEEASLGLSFEDVLDIGVSFSEDYSCEISQSNSVTENILPGQIGNLVFTAFLNCQQGTYTCGGVKTDVIEICTPYFEPGDCAIAGVYSVVISN